MHGLPPADLVEPHLWIVDHFVSRYQQQAPHADLHAAGAHALVEAAARFSPRGGRKFATYAWLWVKGYVLREVRRSHLVVVPEHDVRRANAAGKPIRCGVMTGLPEINPIEWAYADEEPQASPRRRVSTTYTRRGASLFARFLATQDIEQERLSDRAMMLRALEQAIPDLDCPDQRRAVKRALAGKSVEEIARAMKCTQARVAELLAAAENELREMMT